MERKLRVAVWHNVPSGGARRALHNHLTGLIELGHEVEIWSPPSSENAKFASFEGLAPEHVVPLDHGPDAPPGKLARVKAWLNQADRWIKAECAHAREVARQVEARGFDVLFANTDVNFHSPFVCRASILPTVLYLQEPNRPYFEAPDMAWLPPDGYMNLSRKAKLHDLINSHRIRRWAREEVENAKACQRVLVNSRFSRESVLRCYGVDAKVCYLGIDLGLFQNLGLPKKRQVVGIGSFGPTKNIELVLRALGTLPDPPKLVWVGNVDVNGYLGAMVALAKELKVPFEPKLLVSDEELIATLNESMAMTYAPRLEPFGFAPIEAGACGLPIVAVAEGGVRETVEHEVNGLLAESDPKEVGQAIHRLLDDPELREKLGKEGERRARELWSNEAANRRLERHLLEVWKHEA